MIGVAARPHQWELVDELFQLFKTPWERAERGRHYRAAVVVDDGADYPDADVLLIYGSRELDCDRRQRASVTRITGPVDLEGHGTRFPVYRHVARFDGAAPGVGLRCEGKAIEYQCTVGTRVIRRIGYDLLGEIHFLLATGQPAQYALTPTLELHVETLRRTLQECGVGFAEVLPRPAEHDFIVCLTHDIDFYGVRRHAFDRTLAGFVARASVGTLIGVMRGRRPVGDLVRNWLTLLRLPFVLLGISPDFWRPFADYEQVEGDRPSTFFLLPFRKRAGRSPDGRVEASRGAAYQISDIQQDAAQAAARGAELGVHGIDAWRDADAARTEAAQLTSHVACRADGIRMHWLYFDDDSPQRLQAAGYVYDSTWGYNEAVGYRAGTSQVFRLNGSTLFELPMSIMDSALFYPSRMDLTEHAASALCLEVVANAKRFGGTVVVNWHDRSLAPERLWGRFYRRLLDDIEDGNRAWFVTAAQAVDWFRWRRSVRFDTAAGCDGVTIAAAGPAPPGAAGVIRVTHPGAVGAHPEHIPFDGVQPVRLKL